MPVIIFLTSEAQDPTAFKLRLSLSLLDFPQNFQSGAPYPFMQQSVEWSNNLYDVSFCGIDALGNVVIPIKIIPWAAESPIMV